MIKSAQGFGIIRLFFMLLFLASIGYVGWTVYEHKQAQTEARVNQDTVMVVKYVGGLCAKSKICASEFRVHNDGTFEGHKPLTDAEVAQLKNMINATDFTSYTSDPEPDCPSAADGQDLVLSFPQKYIDKSFTVCRLDIPPNDPSFNLIKDIISSHQKA